MHFKEHTVANIIWDFLGDRKMALMYLFIVRNSNCITIIGISKEIQCFKIMKLEFVPFGAKIKQEYAPPKVSNFWGAYQLKRGRFLSILQG